RGIRGKKITKLRHLLELRAKKDKLVRGNPLGASQNKKKRLTPTDLRHLFEREAERQRLMVKKAAFNSRPCCFLNPSYKRAFGRQ
uniref:plasmid partitioning protein RepB C-terminal domain-containing protein n=1 Tax=Pseudomonas viridiflava TaxID=33069 RepID=UPI002403F4EF